MEFGLNRIYQIGIIEMRICKNCGYEMFLPHTECYTECSRCGGPIVILKNETYKHFSDRSLLAIYLLLRAARKGATRVQISNDCFRSMWNVSKVHAARINSFARNLRPFFPRHAVGGEPTGGFSKNMLVLYMNEEDDEKRDCKTEYVESLPDQKEIDKELALEITELKTEIDQIEIVKSLKTKLA